MRYFAGIDGGGSKCDVAVIDEEGTVHGWGHSGATGYQPRERAEAAAIDALEQALDQAPPIDRLVVASQWVTGHYISWLAERGIAVESHRAHEWDSTFAAASRTWGLAVHSGTGSWVHCRNPQGRRWQLGGMGPIVGDEGGGWDIGLRGIKAALKSHWSERTRTTLGDIVPRVLGVEDLGRAIIGHPITYGQITRAQIASVARAVIEQAEAGDAIAMRELEAAAASLAEIAELVIDNAGIAGQGYPLIGMAGVIQSAPFYWRILSTKILALDPTLVPEVVPFRMAVGAALDGMRQAGVQVTEQMYNRIRESQTRFPPANVRTSAETGQQQGPPFGGD